MIKAGGIWVSPSEVEDRLMEHPDVAEAAVVAVPDVYELDKPLACIIPMPGKPVNARQLINWCREELAAFKRPRAVIEVAEFPRTANGKIRRNILRERYANFLSV